MSLKDQLKKLNLNASEVNSKSEGDLILSDTFKKNKIISKINSTNLINKFNVSENYIVYSNDPKDLELMSGEKEKLAFQESEQNKILHKQFTVVFRIEKNGRGGKTVTVLDQLPADDFFLKELTKELKTKCGVGGSFQIVNQVGMIEIQGDKRDSIKKILEFKNIKFKGV